MRRYIKGASLTGSAKLVGEVARDRMTEPADLIWYFMGEMIFAPGAAFSVQIPSLPEDARLEANFRAVLKPGEFLPAIEVGRCRLTVPKPVLKAKRPMVSALETIIWYTAFNWCFQI